MTAHLSAAAIRTKPRAGLSEAVSTTSAGMACGVLSPPGIGKLARLLMNLMNFNAGEGG
jgi:uncharacterized membrane protein